MASREFSLRFKDRVGLLGKEGVLNFDILYPVQKEEIPLSKVHDDVSSFKVLNSDTGLLPSTRYSRISPTPQIMSKPQLGPHYELRKNNSVLKYKLPLILNPKSQFLSRHNISCKDLQTSEKKRNNSNSRVSRINSGLTNFKSILTKQMLPLIEKKSQIESKTNFNL